MALAQAKASLTESVLAEVPVHQGTGWWARARNGARDRLAQMGMPVGRDEYWRYTDPKGFTDPAPSFSTETAPSDVFATAEPVTLTFVDGTLDPAQSDALEIEGASVDLLSTAGGLDLHWVHDLYGSLEATGQDPVERPLAALNTAVAAEGVLIHVTGTVARPLRLRYVSTGGQPILHHVVKLDAGASLTLLEEGMAGPRSNIAMEVDIADGAAFDHLRLQGPERGQQSATHLFARLGAESGLKSFTLSAHGALTRNEAVITLTGDDAAAHIAGACLGDGEFHHDDTVFVTHGAERCESRQVFKKVLRNGATGVFQGKILVLEGAQKTDGYQISQSLLLDDDSQFLAKPELEIYADDVVCSHGSTSGAIDDEGLFYLRSRGVPYDIATNLMVLAFMAEAIEEIADSDLQEVIVGQLEQLLNTGGQG